jgi:hypothetical protein
MDVITLESYSLSPKVTDFIAGNELFIDFLTPSCKCVYDAVCVAVLKTVDIENPGMKAV